MTNRRKAKAVFVILGELRSGMGWDEGGRRKENGDKGVEWRGRG